MLLIFLIEYIHERYCRCCLLILIVLISLMNNSYLTSNNVVTFKLTKSSQYWQLDEQYDCVISLMSWIPNSTLIFCQDCKLISLDLSKNQFSDKGGQILGPAVSTNVYLDSLNLSWNQIRRNGAIAIARGIKVWNDFRV